MQQSLSYFIITVSEDSTSLFVYDRRARSTYEHFQKKFRGQLRILAKYTPQYVCRGLRPLIVFHGIGVSDRANLDLNSVRNKKHPCLSTWVQRVSEIIALKLCSSIWACTVASFFDAIAFIFNGIHSPSRKSSMQNEQHQQHTRILKSLYGHFLSHPRA